MFRFVSFVGIQVYPFNELQNSGGMLAIEDKRSYLLSFFLAFEHIALRFSSNDIDSLFQTKFCIAIFRTCTTQEFVSESGCDISKVPKIPCWKLYLIHFFFEKNSIFKVSVVVV